MPRQSAEARSAAVWREGGEHPKPPKHLSTAAKAVWREIVDCRPVDFFQPGALHLLEQLCVMVVAARGVAQNRQHGGARTASEPERPPLPARAAPISSAIKSACSRSAIV
jgi:phage terminase small subunit